MHQFHKKQGIIYVYLPERNDSQDFVIVNGLKLGYPSSCFSCIGVLGQGRPKNGIMQIYIGTQGVQVGVEKRSFSADISPYCDFLILS